MDKACGLTAVGGVNISRVARKELNNFVTNSTALGRATYKVLNLLPGSKLVTSRGST